MSDAVVMAAIAAIPATITAIGTLYVIVKVNSVQTKVDEVHQQTNGLTATAIASAVEAERAKGDLKVDAERQRGEGVAMALKDENAASVPPAK